MKRQGCTRDFDRLRVLGAEVLVETSGDRCPCTQPTQVPDLRSFFFYQLWLFRIFPYLSYPFLGSVQFSTTMPGHCLNPNLLWSMAQRCSKSDGFHSWKNHPPTNMAVCQNLVPLVNIKIAGKWMFIPPKMVLIGIDPYPYIYLSLCQIYNRIEFNLTLI
jgi:hypothetical protein